MCVSVSSQIFWIGLATAIGLLLLFFVSVRGLVREARFAKSAEDWAHVLVGQAPGVFLAGLWLIVAYVAARACGF